MRLDDRFGETFRYELGYRLRSASTWFYGGFLFLIGFWLVHVDNKGSHTITGNAPFRLAELTTLLCGLFGLVVTAGLFSDAALRDRAARMDPLLFTTRLRPAEYLRGRFLAALLVNAVLILATPLGLWLATRMPYLDPEGFGPNHLAAYLQPVLLFSLPNLVLTGAILFTIAALTRQAVPVYLGAIAIFVGYLVASGFWSGITNAMLAALADPLGINALKRMTEYWPASERNSRMVGFPAMLVWNRILWLGIAAAVFALLQRRFSFTERFARAKAETPVDTPSGERAATVASAEEPRNRGTAEPVFGARTRLLQVLAVTRESLAQVVSGRAFPIAFVAGIGLVLVLGWNVGAEYLETVTWPVTHLVASVVVAQRAIVIPWLVIVMFAGELVWKDRETGAAEIADAVPVRTGVMLLGRFLALVALILLLQLAFMIGGILLQVLHGYYTFELGLYLQILFGIKLADYILLAALAMTIHVLVNHKYVGHVLVLLLIAFNEGAGSALHHLLVYNSGPKWMYSDMNGFGPFLAPFVFFKLYWGAWALLLAVVTFLFWPRGPHYGFRQRLVIARARLTRPAAVVAAVAFALIGVFGGFIFYNTNVLNEYLPPQDSGAPVAEYERRYGQHRNLPQPAITAANVRFELYPEKAAADMSGSYAMVNQTGAAIRSVHVMTPRAAGGYNVRSLTFDRPAKAQLVDADYGYRIFALERPLAPGESLRMTFDVAFRPRGFASGGRGTSIVGNGTYVDRRLLPLIGYQPFELTDNDVRKKYGLPPRTGLPEATDAAARRHYGIQRDGDRLPVETIVGTSGDQIAVVPGVLRRSWTENGRRYFHYGTRHPETFATAVFSAKYAVREGRWNDVALQIFHHPAHRGSLDRMLAGMTSALGYYTSQFGPYPYRELRIVEIPPYSGIGGRAFPSAIAFGEVAFLTRGGDGLVDLAFFGAAHEVAHQWWGGQVRPAYVKGRSFVSESLSNYSAMMVTEKTLGPAEARRVYDFQMDRYLRNRADTGKDAPLLQVDDHPHVSYGKGAVALYTLREHIGADAVNTALKRFLEKFGRTGPPYATSLDLYAELRAVTPPALHYLLTDLFETITLWALNCETATARRLPDGNYEVTVNVHAQKLRADGVGRETVTPMDELVEVGVFADGNDTPIYKARHRIRSGQQTVKLIVSGEPLFVRLDPEAKLIERDREDNAVEVEKGQ